MTNVQRRIIVAVDGSEESEYALSWTLKEIYRNGDKLHLVYVKSQITSATSASLISAPDVINYLHERGHALAKSVVEKLTNVCQSSNVQPFIEVISGEPRDVICNTVETCSADLLIVGCRGLTGVKRAFLGSVSDYCIHNAKCPVMVVKRN